MTATLPVRHQAPTKVKTHALVGTLAVAWLLFGGRWISYIGLPPLFATDMLLGAAVVHWGLSRRYDNERLGVVKVDAPHPALTLFFLYALTRFLVGGDYTLDAIRDAVPYLYAFIGIVAGVAVQRATQATRDRTAKILVAALALRTVWVFVSVTWPGFAAHMPVVAPAQGLTLFKTRGDLESAVVAVFGAWMLVKLATGSRHPVWAFLAAVMAWVTVLSTESRAAVLGAGTIGALTLFAVLKSREVHRGRQMVAAMSIPVLLAAVVLLLPATTVGQSLGGTFTPDSTSAASLSAQGTTQARERTWQYLWDYSQETTPRFAFGVGYGPNFMAETSALTLLTGASGEVESNPRAPHNYALNTLLRGGLVGVALMLWLAVAIIMRALRLALRLPHDPLLFLATMMCVGLMIPALFGVILESPFGAVPFFWGAGVLLATKR